MVLAVTLSGTGPVPLEGPTELYGSPATLTFPINGLPPGAYTITVKIADESENQSEATVHFTIIEAPVEGTGGGEESSTGADTGAPTTSGQADTAAGSTGAAETTGVAESTGVDTASASDGPGDASDGGDGCGCRSDDPRPLAPLLLPLALGLRRRRSPGAPRRDRR